MVVGTKTRAEAMMADTMRDTIETEEGRRERERENLSVEKAPHTLNVDPW
jgi:hypothetical protein